VKSEAGDCLSLELLVGLYYGCQPSPLKEGYPMLRSKGFLRVKEAAQLLGVSINTVRAWGALGKIPEYRHPANNYRMYKQADLERINAQIEQSIMPPAATQRPNRPR